eukprot:scaffold246318_cov25-Prasinocladus_malaysianus.AAC.2
MDGVNATHILCVCCPNDIVNVDVGSTHQQKLPCHIAQHRSFVSHMVIYTYFLSGDAPILKQDNNENDRFIPRWYQQTKQPRHQSNNNEGLEMCVSICPHQRGMNEPPGPQAVGSSLLASHLQCILESPPMSSFHQADVILRCLKRVVDMHGVLIIYNSTRHGSHFADTAVCRPTLSHTLDARKRLRMSTTITEMTPESCPLDFHFQHTVVVHKQLIVGNQNEII